ncbi:MAG: glucose-6-phosphate isomerase [Leptospiraceae bacterium]|nr:glucose-6-phosphate isomerase [Leptospiraceae bacterium]MDW7974936.1 glucose-6-phosphate isomerase [Leptospiraceae bacterium]
MDIKTLFLEKDSFNLQDYNSFYGKKLVSDIYKKIEISKKEIEARTSRGAEFLGWLELPEIELQNLEKYKNYALFFQNYETIVSIGIGGSYLGIRAIYEALKKPFQPSKKELLFAGHHLSSRYLKSLLDYLENKNFALIVISKSGTTTEPALSFRFLFQKLKEKFGGDVQNRIVIITDQKKGVLREFAHAQNLRSDVVPDDVGGRYSVLCPVGLVPLAIVGISIEDLLLGAKSAMQIIRKQSELESNPAISYAMFRVLNYSIQKPIEILVSYRPELYYFMEWWKQLFGESEGKEYKGIFPASSLFTTDLHSLGQWIQEGHRNIFETIIDVVEDEELPLPKVEEIRDGFQYLENQSLNTINRIALKATRRAHLDGGVPQFTFEVPRLSEYYLGALIYLFEYACALSSLAMGVNPFDQPGVEAYKSNMMELLKKI